MKVKLLLALFILPLFLFGNMADPTAHGSKVSTLYGVSNCVVSKENISIKLFNTNDSDRYIAKYKITYFIDTKVDQNIKLLFIGLDLYNRQNVWVNNEVVETKSYDLNDSSKISFSLNESIDVNEEDLIYFEANLKKGKNTIIVEYDAELEHNRFGFLRNYKLNYSLYPSKFWESFGTINLELELDKNLEITSSNIGNPKIEYNNAKWIINEINVDTIQLEISNKVSLLSKILLFIKPLGISIIALFIMFLINLKLIISNNEHKKFKYLIPLSTIIIPILFYYIYFKAYDLIDYSLGQENSKHGYVFFFVFTLPFLMIIYGLVLHFLNKKYKKEL